jgi:hypothetical protein
VKFLVNGFVKAFFYLIKCDREPPKHPNQYYVLRPSWPPWLGLAPRISTSKLRAWSSPGHPDHDYAVNLITMDVFRGSISSINYLLFTQETESRVYWITWTWLTELSLRLFIISNSRSLNPEIFQTCLISQELDDYLKITPQPYEHDAKSCLNFLFGKIEDIVNTSLNSFPDLYRYLRVRSLPFKNQSSLLPWHLSLKGSLSTMLRLRLDTVDTIWWLLKVHPTEFFFCSPS